MTRNRWVLVFITVLLLALGMAASAQAEPFVIRSPISSLSPDGGTIVVQFDVTNNGAQNATTVARLFDSRGLQLTSEPLQLPSGRQSVTLNVPVERFEAGTRPTLYITVGLETLPGNLRSSSNIASISVSIPASPDSDMTDAPNGQGSNTSSGLPFDIPLNLNDPVQVVLAVAIFGLFLLLLWVISVIIRSLTTRVEPFAPWQAAYPSPPYIDPNTTTGRRYLWQQHAQNDSLSLPCAPGTIVARKHVIGNEGEKFIGWNVTGIRTGRYDQYGRIGRTNHVASAGVTRRLDRAARRRKVSVKSAPKIAAPIAKALVKEILKSSDKRSAILPIALEIRFKGKANKTQTAFELFQCDGNGWQLMDSWSAPPTQSVNGGNVEQFSYTFFGQRHNEPKKNFQKRLESDLTQIIAALVFKPERPKLEDTASHPPVEMPPEAPPTIKQDVVIVPPPTEEIRKADAEDEESVE